MAAKVGLKSAGKVAPKSTAVAPKSTGTAVSKSSSKVTDDAASAAAKRPGEALNATKSSKLQKIADVAQVGAAVGMLGGTAAAMFSGGGDTGDAAFGEDDGPVDENAAAEVVDETPGAGTAGATAAGDDATAAETGAASYTWLWVLLAVLVVMMVALGAWLLLRR